MLMISGPACSDSVGDGSCIASFFSTLVRVGTGLVGSSVVGVSLLVCGGSLRLCGAEGEGESDVSSSAEAEAPGGLASAPSDSLKIAPRDALPVTKAKIVTTAETNPIQSTHRPKCFLIFSTYASMLELKYGRLRRCKTLLGGQNIRLAAARSDPNKVFRRPRALTGTDYAVPVIHSATVRITKACHSWL